MIQRRMIVLILCVLILSGCGKEKYTDDFEVTNNNAVVNDRYVSEFDLPCYGTSSDIGVYYLVEPKRTISEIVNGEKLLYWNFYNYSTGYSSVLCTKAGCEHGKSSTCEAVFFDSVLNVNTGKNVNEISDLMYYQGRLYRVSYNEKNGLRLLSYDSTGNDVKMILNIEKDPTWKISYTQKAWTIYDGNLYIQLYQNNEGLTKYKYVKINISDEKDKKTILEYKAMSGYDKSGVRIVEDGGKIYLYENLGTIHKSGELNNFAVYSYDVLSDKLIKEFDSMKNWTDEESFIKCPAGFAGTGMILPSFAMTISGKDIYFVFQRYEQATVYQYDMNSDKFKKLNIKDENEALNTTLLKRECSTVEKSFLAADDKNLYYMSAGVRVENDADAEMFLNEYLSKGNIMCPILYVFNKDTLDVVYKYEFDAPYINSEILKGVENQDKSKQLKTIKELYGKISTPHIIGSTKQGLVVSLPYGCYIESEGQNEVVMASGVMLDKNLIGTGNEAWKYLYKILE